MMENNRTEYQPAQPFNVKRPTDCKGLSASVDSCLERYFKDLGGMTPPPNLYDTVMSQMEKPLIEHVLQYVRGNQVRAAAVLGINRNTLRKKIAHLDINLETLVQKKPRVSRMVTR